MSEAHMRFSSATEFVETIKLALTSPEYRAGHVEMAIRPTQMLAGFAAELYLKAWLLGDGMPPPDVRRFGHRLRDLYNEALKRGFPVYRGIAALINLLAEPHGQNGDYVYRYTAPGASIDVVNWAEALPIFQTMASVVDHKIGARVSHGLSPIPPHPLVV